MHTWVLIFVLIGAFVTYTLVEYRNTKKRLKDARTAQAEQRNVYIITASGLRPDHLSSYQYQHIQTPALDYLAQDGVRFTNAFSTSPESLAAHLSILSGMYPFRSPVRKILEFWNESKGSSIPSTDALSVLFKEKEYPTAAILSDPELRFPSLFGRIFATVYSGDKQLHFGQSAYSVAEASRLAREWVLNHKKERHFLLLNFNEPSLLFEPPPPFDRHYTNYPYDGEIAALDEQVGLFLNMLKSTGLYQRSILVFTAPFTESLERTIRSGSLEEVTLKVPLLIVAPGILPRLQLYENRVSLIDVAPTILSFLDWKVGDKMDGFALFERGTRNEISRNAVLAQTGVPALLGLPPLYAAFGPGGKHSTVNPKPSTKAEEGMKNQLEAELKKEGMSPAYRSATQSAVESGALVEEVMLQAKHGKYAIAFDLLASFEGDSATPAILRWMGDLAMDAKDPATAQMLYEKAFSISKNPELLPRLARSYLRNQKIEDAKKALNLYQKSGSVLSYDIYNMMGSVELDSGKGEAKQHSDTAIQYLNQAIELNPKSMESYIERGRAYASLGKNDQAISDLQKAIQLDRNSEDANRLLAAILIQHSRKRDAIPYLEHVIRLNPTNYRAMLELASVHEVLGNRKEVMRLCQKVLLNSYDESERQQAKQLIAH